MARERGRETRASSGAAPLRIATWSGPRNLSTALMRAFGQRADTAVCDEPLYAHYLAATGRPHPGAAEVIARHESDWRAVAAWLTGPVPDGKRVFYQKHMAHHLLPGIGREWLGALEHCFLVRDPRAMLPSLDKLFPEPRLEDTGLPQQLALFEEVRERTGRVPAVIDARDLLEDPRGVLAQLCERLGLAFDEAMLAWPPGRRATDGVWAEHWYASVERSEGFVPYRAERAPFPERLRPLLEECRPLYERLHSFCILARRGA